MEAEQFRRISKALADPRRYELLKRIASCDEAACLALRPEIPVSAATLSHHVKMRHFGFKSDKKGQKHGQATGKVAVVTGASKGIGAAIAEKLGSEGANVVVNYSTDRVGAEKVAQKINASGAKATVIKANLARPQEVKLLFAAFGKIDILVNNAGVYEFLPLEKIDEDHFRRHFDLNVLGLLLATQAAVENINGDGASIINVSSIASKTPPAGASVYSATKGAVDVITRSLAQELGPRKIRVNSLSPGFTDTEGVRAMPGDGPEFRDHMVSRTPLGRAGTVDDIASAALFLASDESRWVTGEEILVGGGIRL